MRLRAVILAALLPLGAGCDRAVQSNPNAPGRPGTGNTPEVARPSMPDTAPGGSSGMKDSLPHPGSSGGDAVPGTTGSGTSEPGGRSQSAQPGQGLAGGMAGSLPGASTATQGSVAEGSPNRTPSGRVGSR
jgi:hypothetical protein